MDAIKFLEERNRMCGWFKRCALCPLNDIDCTINTDAKKELVEIVEKWSTEHPLTTNGEAAVGMMEKMDAPYIRCRKNEVGQVEMILDASWWDAEYKGESNE